MKSKRGTGRKSKKGRGEASSVKELDVRARKATNRIDRARA